MKLYTNVISKISAFLDCYKGAERKKSHKPVLLFWYTIYKGFSIVQFAITISF